MKKPRPVAKTFSFVFIGLGVASLSIVLLPLLDWQFQYNFLFGQGNLAVPLPRAKVVQPEVLPNVFANSVLNLSGVDYTNARNWFPENPNTKTKDILPVYLLSIPKLGITKAQVSSVSDDLAKNLVHYGGTGIPGKPGNAVIFGHSTLPQLFNPKDYKAIFATIHTMKVGDDIIIDYDNVTYTYTISNIQIVDPDNVSVLSQQYDDSYLTVITCTPPGTYWKRLVIKAKVKNVV